MGAKIQPDSGSNGLVDGLVTDAHARVVRVLQRQTVGHLLGRPLAGNSLNDVVPKASIREFLGGPARFAALFIPPLAGLRRVPIAAAIAPQFPANRAVATVQFPSNGSDPQSLVPKGFPVTRSSPLPVSDERLRRETASANPVLQITRLVHLVP